jgi:FKBP-type peptidyl-prolyl cis-trans isomerase (trigger factor)
MALEEIAEREGLTVADEEIEAAVNNALAEDPEVARRARDLRTADPVREYFRHQLLMRKTIEYLSSLAAPESSDTMNPPADVPALQGAGTSASMPSGETKER